MEPRLSIRIEEPEDEHLPVPLLVMTVLSMIFTFFSLYVLLIEFLNIPPDPLIGSLAGIS